MQDLTIVYYTANFISDAFLAHTRKALLEAAGDTPIVSISHKPMDLGENLVVNYERSYLSIYRQALLGALEAKTRYIAMAEDDVLYSKDHFEYRPNDGVFAYDKSIWSLYTWVKPPLFSWKDRRVMVGLVCERDLFIEAMQERFEKHPNDEKIDISLWSEPGKYERQLGVTVRETEVYYSKIPSIAFSHEKALAYNHLGTRKRLGNLRATALPQWGTAEEVLALYE